jgi:hypothetical protein
MFIVVEYKKWVLVSAENENSHWGLFPCACLSLAHQLLTPLGTLAAAVSKSSQLNYFMYMNTHLQFYASGSD